MRVGQASGQASKQGVASTQAMVNFVSLHCSAACTPRSTSGQSGRQANKQVGQQASKQALTRKHFICKHLQSNAYGIIAMMIIGVQCGAFLQNSSYQDKTEGGASKLILKTSNTFVEPAAASRWPFHRLLLTCKELQHSST